MNDKKKMKNDKTKAPRKKMSKRRVLNSVVIVFLSLVLIGGVTTFFILNQVINDAPALDQSSLKSGEATQLYDKDGKAFTSLGNENRKNIKYEDLPQSVIDAFLSIEDSRFFEHNGFDLPRFMKAAMENLSAGNLGQGGSTLTMQLIDNAIMTKLEKTDPATSSIKKIERKIQEIWLSLKLEKDSSKQEIMVDYLNKVNFGNAARGIQRGAEYYFGKDVQDLTLSESAFLAGVINAPNTYNPYKSAVYNFTTKDWTDHYQLAEQRRNQTLKLMNYHGFITDEEYKLAKSTKLAFQLNGEKTFNTDPYQGYIDTVQAEVLELTNGKVDINTGGYKVYTGMNLGAQELADSILNGTADINYPDSSYFQTGFTLMDNQTGEIIAVGAGRNYTGDDRTNYANDRRQPGSSIKPLLDYAPTFDYLGWATSMTLEDTPMTYRGTNIPLYNYSRTNVGDVTMGDAVAHSLNTTAMQSLEELVDKVGIEKMQQLMIDMGFDKDVVKDFDLGYSIGGSNMQTTTKQMAGAYSIFANGGKYIKPHTVRKVVDTKTGKVVAETDYASKSKQVISGDAAFMMSDLLKNAVDGNWGNLLQILRSNYPVYAKSGTSDWGTEGSVYGIPTAAMKDKWICAYTSNYTIATWAGYENKVKDPASINYVTDAVMNMNVPGQISHKMLDYMSTQTELTSIQQPSTVTKITHIKGLYPYTAALEGTPSDMLITGYIRSKFAKLESAPSADQLSTPSSFTAKLTDSTSNTLEMKFAAYPDADKLKEGSHTKTFTRNGIKWSGHAFYDPTDLFGRVMYKVDVTVDGSKVGTYSFDKESVTQTIAIPAGKTAKVCGYYGYKNTNNGQSSAVCVNVTRDADKEEPDPTPDPDPNPDPDDNTNNNRNGKTLYNVFTYLYKRTS